MILWNNIFDSDLKSGKLWMLVLCILYLSMRSREYIFLVHDLSDFHPKV